jgi:hypothetical protein
MARNVFRNVIAFASLLPIVGGCGFYESLSPGPVPENYFADQAYRHLFERCTFEFGHTASPAACRCYAENVAGQMSKTDLNSYSVTGILPISVRADHSMAACRRR